LASPLLRILAGYLYTPRSHSHMLKILVYKMLFSSRAVNLAIGLAASCVTATTSLEKQGDAESQAGLSLDYDGVTFKEEYWCPAENLDCPVETVLGEDGIPLSKRHFPSMWYGEIPIVDIDEHAVWVQWRGSDSNYPVVLEWRVGEPSEKWKGERDSVVLTSNITTTDNNIMFKIKLSELLKSAMGKSNSTSQEFTTMVSPLLTAGTTYFYVSQPDRPTDGLDLRAHWGGKSQPFTVFANRVPTLIALDQFLRELDAEKALKRWRLTLGLLLGVALPIATTVAFLLGMWTVKRQTVPMQRIPVSEKIGFEYPEQHRVSSSVRHIFPLSLFKRPGGA
jgi:hypothetical protein